MHRHLLVRAAAYERLHQLATAEQLALTEHAERVLEAVDLLAQRTQA